MCDKNLFDYTIGQMYSDIVVMFPHCAMYIYDNVAEIELEEGTLACYFHEDKCSRWSFYFHDEGKPDYHSVPFVDLFPAWVYSALPDGFGRVGLS